MFPKISVSSVAPVQVSSADQVYTHSATTQRTSIALCITALQKPECPGRQVYLCFSPALALGWVQAAASALTRLQLSALLGFEESPSPGPETVPGSWSGSGFFCSACPWEGCGAGRRKVEAGGPAGGGGALLVLASSAAKDQKERCQIRAAMSM